MKLFALTIGGNGSTPTYHVSLPLGLGTAGSVNIQTIVTFALNLLITVAILLSFFFVLFGGLKWMMSQGDKKQVEEAQKTLTFAIIGLVIVLLSFFLLNLFGFAFQVPLSGN